jgi:hypothetical protein
MAILSLSLPSNLDVGNVILTWVLVLNIYVHAHTYTHKSHIA